MSYSIVQHKSQINGSAIPGTFTLTSAPTPGNRIVAFVGMNITDSSLTLNTANWRVLKRGLDENGTFTFQCILTRIAQIGDTSTLPAFATAGTTYSSYLVYEVSGGTGTDANDIIGVFYDSAHGSRTSFPLSEMICPAGGALALVGANRYNGNSNPSISGTWAGDEAQNNSGNFGSVFGAHQSFSDGGAISDTVTIPVTANPGAWGMVLLGDATVLSRPFVRQASRGRTNTAAFLIGSMNLGAKPLTGSLLLSHVGREKGNVATPTWDATTWSVLTHADGATGQQVTLLYRYADGSENGAALPSLTTGGSNAFTEAHVIEVVGVTGTIGTDVVFADSDRQATGSSLTTTSRNTSGPHQLGIIFASNYNASGAEPSLSGSFNSLARADDTAAYGTVRIGQQEYASAGTAVQSTITYSHTTDPSGWAQVVVSGAGGGGGGGSTGSNAQVIIVTTG